MLVRITAPAQGDRALQRLLTVVWALNRDYLRAVPDAPRLYQSGVRYQREPAADRGSIEEFATIPVVAGRGWGDCDDLAPWRAAELCEREGVDARPQLVEVAPRRWHVVVVDATGRVIDDPSARLGMLDGAASVEGIFL